MAVIWGTPCSGPPRASCKSIPDRCPPDSVQAQPRFKSRAPRRSYIARDQTAFRAGGASPRGIASMNARGMSMRRIDCQHVHLGLFQVHGALQEIAVAPMAAPTTGGPGSLLRVRKLNFLLYVLECDQPFEAELGVTTSSFFIRCVAGCARPLQASCPRAPLPDYLSSITLLTAWSRFFSKRRSRLVKMPTGRPCVTGKLRRGTSS